MGKIEIDKEKLMAEYTKAKQEYDNFENPSHNFFLNSFREFPMIRYCNLKYYLDNLIIEKDIINGFIADIEENIKFAKEHDNIIHELKLIETLNTQRFVLSISKDVL